MEEEKEPGLRDTTAVMMIVTALFFDFLQFLLGFIYMGWLVGIFAGLTFWLWFRMHGISFIKNPKRIMVFGGASIVEMLPIPFLASLPGWTLAVVYLALNAKIKKVISHVPGGNIASNVIAHKRIAGRNASTSNNLEKLKSSNETPEEIRVASNKRHLEHNDYMTKSNKDWEETMKFREESEARHRKSMEDYGGSQKFHKDLSEVRYKYRNSSSSSDKAA